MSNFLDQFSFLDSDPELGDQPCLKGTAVPVSQILAQLADGKTVDELTTQMSLDKTILNGFLMELAASLDKKEGHLLELALDDYLREVKKPFLNIKIGMTREEVVAIIGEPEAKGGVSRKYKTPMIYRYGEVELWFGKERDGKLFTVYHEPTNTDLFEDVE